MTEEKAGPPRRKFGSLGFVAVLLILTVGAVFAYMWIHKDDLQQNERNARASLKTLASAEATFRVKDSDGNGVKDYWTADVAGLWHAGKLIDEKIAKADVAPLKPLANKPLPYHGYYFAAMTMDLQNQIVYRTDTDKSGRKVHNTSRFGFCAYPAHYGSSGNWTFIINENNTIFKVETGGKPLENWPTDQGLVDDWGPKGD